MNSTSINSVLGTTNTICIVYENNEPIHMFCNRIEAYDYMINTGDRKLSCIKNILEKAHINSIDLSDLVNINMSDITYTNNGVCTSYKWYRYNHTLSLLKNQRNSVSDTAQDKLSGESVDTSVRMTTKSMPQQEQINIHDTTQNIKNICKQSKYSSTNLEDEMIKLTQKLIETSEHNQTKLIPDLEKVYSGVAEEAMLDNEIKKMKKHIGNVSDDEESNINNYSDLIASEYEESNINNDSDLIASDYEENLSVDNIESDEEVEITDDMPQELKSLIRLRNELNNSIQEQSVIVGKANEKLNEDFFNKRCEDQNKRRHEQKNLEGISILMSDKNTYLKLVGRIKRGILQEKNIPPLFIHKYHILKFMEQNECIEFTKTADTNKEYYVFSQLQKVMDIYELNDPDNASDNESDNNSLENSKYDIIDKIDQNYMSLCMEFLEILEQSNGSITSDKKIHSILNDNPDIKKAIFKDTVDTTVFNKDTDKEHYKRI
jgi:hypothetical protein